MAPLLVQDPLLFLGQGRGRGPPPRVEARHDPGLAPSLKEFPEPPNTDAPPSGHLAHGLVGDGLFLSLADQPLDAAIGETSHVGGGDGAESRPPPGPPLSTERNPADSRSFSVN